MSHPLGQLFAADAPLKWRSAGYLSGAAALSQKRRMRHPSAFILATFSCMTFGGLVDAKLWPALISTARAEPAAEPTRLIVNQPKGQKKGLAVPLGVSVKNSVEGGLVVIGGLIKGTKLSAGHAVGDKNWYLFATDLENVMVEPPQDFTGIMDISVELLLADTAVADRHVLRFQWGDPQTADTGQNAPKKEVTLKLPPEEIETLLKRGESLMRSGDVTAARLVLTRPAEAGDARAAYALATTYDRVILEKLHAFGLSPDPTVAQYWYDKAKQLGSTDRTALGGSPSKQN